ncbi:MAG: hypothetical protein FWD23_11725 [Oscillospiraceae bacterium]|nr:hypothetical protein [Oscillospiraceae bacterium]
MPEKEKFTEINPQDIPLDMDEIMKMMFGLSDRLTIRMINSLFGKDIALDAKVTAESAEKHRFSLSEPAIDEIRTDMILNISGERYHIEFQTVNDKAMPVRMFEYGFVIAIQEVKSYISHFKDGIKLDYPKQYVIFVEQDDDIPERELSMAVTLWDGDEKEYKVPLMKYWTETTDSLEAKHLEPLLPLQVFKIRKSLAAIAKSKKPEKEKLIEEKLREIITIYTEVTEKIRDLTENKEQLTSYHAEQMLMALQHLSEYLYSNYKNYRKIESEAIHVTESKWMISKVLRQGEQIGELRGELKGELRGELKSRKETAYEMFLDGKNIIEIRKYSKLQDEDLADVLANMPEDIQSKYSLLNN